MFDAKNPDLKNLLGQIDTNSLVGKMIKGMATKNFAAGVLTGGVAGSLFGGKDSLESLTKLGGLALLGTLAYKTYHSYQQQQASGQNPNLTQAVKNSAQDMVSQAQGLFSGLFQGNASVGNTSDPRSLTAATAQAAAPSAELTLAIIRAMIGAAKADGHVDGVESQKIIGHLQNHGLTSDENMLIMQEMANPQQPSVIAKGASSAQDAAQIYLAAVLVCDSQCEREKAYLDDLATALKLEPAFTTQLQADLLRLQSEQAA